MNTFAKMATTLMYSFWKGLAEGLYHFDGTKPSCFATNDPDLFVEKQDRVTRLVFRTCERHLNVAGWEKDAFMTFGPAQHVAMLRDAVQKMQNNNRSHGKRCGEGRPEHDGNWGGHGMGAIKRFIEPDEEECPVDEGLLYDNSCLGQGNA